MPFAVHLMLGATCVDNLASASARPKLPPTRFCTPLLCALRGNPQSSSGVFLPPHVLKIRACCTSLSMRVCNDLLGHLRNFEELPEWAIPMVEMEHHPRS